MGVVGVVCRGGTRTCIEIKVKKTSEPSTLGVIGSTMVSTGGCLGVERLDCKGGGGGGR